MKKYLCLVGLATSALLADVQFEKLGLCLDAQPGHSRLAFPLPVTPGEVYEFEIDLWVTSNLFIKGHGIRVEISSSNFPRFDGNLNTGDPIANDASPRRATQMIYHDAEHPSHIMLPIIPNE